MSLPILKTCKMRNRAPKLFGLNAFCDPGCPINPTGAFRDNMRVFLQECAEIEDYNIDTMSVWCTLLVQENKGVVLPLYTIEEHVKFSKQPFCDHCRCSGNLWFFLVDQFCCFCGFMIWVFVVFH